MYRVYYNLFNDVVWVGDFPTYDMALEHARGTAEYQKYENGVKQLEFTILKDRHLYKSITICS